MRSNITLALIVLLGFSGMARGAYVKNPVTSGSKDVRAEFARIAASTGGSGTCSVTSQSAGFISATPTGTTNSCTITFATAFSVAPACVCSSEAVSKECEINSVSTSAVTYNTLSSAGGDTTAPVAIYCMGVR
jgi:hypothetical protein